VYAEHHWASAQVQKPKLNLMTFWRLSVEKTKSQKLQETIALDVKVSSQICNFCLQDSTNFL
jgi:hypothetical protein